MSDSGGQDFTPVGAPGIQYDARRDGAWHAPGTGTPLSPDEAVKFQSKEIASQVVSRLMVPRGPLRTLTFSIGLSPPISNLIAKGALITTGALNSIITQPILAAPGVIRYIDVQAQLITTGATAGILQFFDNDTNSPLLRSFIFNVGAAGTFTIQFSSAPELGLPFLNGILGVWTPISATPAFGACIICCNIDFESIPIGQRLDQS